MLGLIGLDIPGLRQLAGFLFLTFVPGILILRILKIHNIGLIESLLYSVGLSIAFVMATGVVVNFALPPLGVSQPLTVAPLAMIFTVFFLILCFLAYKRDKDFRRSNPPPEDNEKIAKLGSSSTIKPFLLAVLLPLLAILGTSLVNSYQSNYLLLALIFIIAILVILVAFNKFIPEQVYPFMILMMALALLYQTTLISNYLVGSDIHQEYYWGKLIIENGYWDAAIPGGINSCLSIVMLAPVYSLLLNMDVAWLFKIIYPLFFSLLPLTLFQIFRSQIGSRYAFLAAFFFIAMPMFFMDLTQLARQQISELFFVLVILLMVDRKLTLMQRTILVIVFSFGVVVSHYGMGTGYVIGYLACGALLLIFIKSRPGRTVWQWLIGKSHSLPRDLTAGRAFNKKALAIIVGVGLISMFVYYGVTSVGLEGPRVAAGVGQSLIERVIHGITTPPPAEISLAEIPPTEIPPTEIPPTEMPPAEMPPAETPPTETPPIEISPAEIPPTETPTVEVPGLIQNIIARFPFLNPLAKEPLAQTALGLDFTLGSLGGKVWRIFQYLVELCLIVGFFRLIFRPRALGFKFKAEYISLTIISALILLGIYVLPIRGWGLGTPRIFGITLLLMSPLLLLGGEFIGQGIVKFAKIFRRRLVSWRLILGSHAPLGFFVLVIMIPYFIFNSGVAFELSRSQTTSFINMPYSIALSSYRLDVTSVFTKQDVTAADWLYSVAGEDYILYADRHGYQALRERFGSSTNIIWLNLRSAKVYPPLYFYLRAWNVQKKVLTFPTAYAARESISFADLPLFMQIMEKADIIYNNGAQVLALPETEKVKE
jgi:uncharacterized membrane protein